jgi:hypothetical protein
MFDSGDFAIGNVWIPRDLRRWRNGNRNHDARHHGNVGHRGELWNINAVRHINFVGHVGDLGTVDVLRNDGNVGIVRDVRRRLQQPRCVIVSNVVRLNVVLAEWQRSSRNSAGFFRDWQSWGQPHNGGTYDKRVADNRQRGEFSPIATTDAHCFISGHWFICDVKPCPVKTILICKREQP